jgi:hypothetical protein
MAKDANLGITAHNPVVPAATSYLKGNIPAEAATAINAAHGMHVQPNVPPAAVLISSDSHLTDAAAALGNQVMADGTAEAPHLDAHGNKTA